MSEKFTVFDVETPNAANDRICSIGLSVIENGEIIESRNIFVNPECAFDQLNIRIHGITEAAVKNASIFPQIWCEIRPIFYDRVVIAHNACFDLSVLRKTLTAYGIEDQPLHYIDTVKAARDIYPFLPDHKLNTLCDYLEIPLNHHDSGSDSRATAELFLDMCRRGMDVNCFARRYTLCGCEDKRESIHSQSRLSSESYALLELLNVLSAITADGKINFQEMERLRGWIKDHPELAGNYPYDTVYRQIEVILEDGIVEELELNELHKVCKQLIDPVGNGCPCAQTSVDVKGKNVVLSGEFSIGSKAKVESILTERGAAIQKSVTSKTNIVLVGNEGNNAWVAGNYGTKVKKAMELQAKGVNVVILKESEYFAK